MPGNGDLKIQITDIMGKVVKAYNYNSLEAGTHTIAWNGTSSDGTQLASGLYFCKAITAEKTTTIKLVLEK